MGKVKEVAKKLYRTLHPRQRRLQKLKRSYGELFAAAQNQIRLAQAEGEQAEVIKREAFLEMPCLDREIALLQEGNGLLLRMLKKICGRHGISFWILGGTLLGAVRHRGFIPWDDDVDVGMLRGELEKLKAVMPAYPQLCLEEYYNNRPYRGKAHATQTVKLTARDEKSPFWLDILVYDRAGNGADDGQALWSDVTAVRRELERSLIALEPELERTYWDEIVSAGDRQKIDAVYRRFFGKLPEVTKETYIYRGLDSVCGAWQQLFPAERMFPPVELEFSGDLYPAPRDYDWYLRLQYGDYLALPEDIGEIHAAFSHGKMAHAKAALARLKQIRL